MNVCNVEAQWPILLNCFCLFFYSWGCFSQNSHTDNIQLYPWTYPTKISPTWTFCSTSIDGEFPRWTRVALVHSRPPKKNIHGKFGVWVWCMGHPRVYGYMLLPYPIPVHFHGKKVSKIILLQWGFQPAEIHDWSMKPLPKPSVRHASAATGPQQ